MLSTEIVARLILPALLMIVFANARPSIAQSISPELVTQRGHSARVHALAFSSDSRWLAAADATGVHLWDIKNSRDLRTFPGFSPRMVAISADGQRLAVDDATSLTVWDTGRAKILKRLPTGLLQAIALNSDGSVVAWIEQNNSGILMHDLVADSDSQIVTNFKQQPSTLVFSPDGHLLASASAEEIRTYDVQAKVQRDAIFGHTSFHPSLVFTHDGAWLAATAEDEDVRIFEVSTGRELEHVTGHGDVISLAFTKDNFLAASHRGTYSVSFWNPKTKETTTQRIGDSILPVEPRLSPDAELLVAPVEDPRTNTLRVWEVASATQLSPLRGATSRVLDLDVAPNGKLVASVNETGALDIWGLGSGTRVLERRLGGIFKNALAFSPDGTKIALSNGNVLELIDSSSGQIIKKMAGHAGRISSIAFRPDGKMIATGADDKTIRLWDPESGVERKQLLGHSSWIGDLVYSPDNKWLVSTTLNETKIWDAATFIERRTMESVAQERREIVFSPNSQYLAAVSSYSVRLIEVPSGAVRTIEQPLTAEQHLLVSIAFDPNGDVLVVGTKDGAILLVSVSDGRVLGSLSAHQGAVTALSFLSGGAGSKDKFLFSSGDDGTIMLWNFAKRQLLATMISLQTGRDWLVTNPQGLFDGSGGGWTQVLWRFGTTFDVLPVESFFADFYEPGLLAEVFADKTLEPKEQISSVDRRLPTVRIRLAEESTTPPGTPTKTREVEVRVEVQGAQPDSEHPAKGGVRDLRLFRNDLLVAFWQGMLHDYGQTGFTAKIPIVAGRNRITAYVFNDQNIKSEDGRLTIVGDQALGEPARAHILAIGINQYMNRDFNLRFAEPDAQSLGKEVAGQLVTAQTVTRFESVVLLNERARREDIVDAIKALGRTQGHANAPQLSLSQPEDTIIIYFAGHGIAYKEKFYLIPYDMGYLGTRKQLDKRAIVKILQHGISSEDIEELLVDVDARNIVLIIDACKSGQILESEEPRQGPLNSKGLAQLAYDKGMYVLTAAQSYQNALESTRYGHGLLTYALEEALKTDVADVAPRDGAVDVREWMEYASRRVPELQAETTQARDISFQSASAGSGADVEQRPRMFVSRKSESEPMVVARPVVTAPPAVAAPPAH
jgi:WD40 repeat protein/uncharacterized caspase-like protein